MADSETTVPTEEQTADEGEVAPENNQQEAVSGDGNDTAGEATQQVAEEGQEASTDNAQPQENTEGDAAADGEAAADAGGDNAEGGDATLTEEQASAEEPAATETAEQQESEPQQDTGSEASAEPESKTEEQQDAEEQALKEAEPPTVELSEEEKAKCQKLFDRKAVDGRLDIKGFKVLFRLLGQVISAEDSDAMFKEVNSSENGGTIDFSDFCVLYGKFCEGEQARKEGIMNSINKLFPNSDGEPVRLKRVEGILMKLQQPDLDMRLVREKSDLNPSDIKSLVRSMDKNGDGYISKEEFVETLTMHLDTM